MPRLIIRVQSVELAGAHSLVLRFNDGTCRRVDLLPELEGPVFEPLRDPAYFSQVTLDPVAGTVVWPNGADFAPDFLRELPEEHPARSKKKSAHPRRYEPNRLTARR